MVRAAVEDDGGPDAERRSSTTVEEDATTDGTAVDDSNPAGDQDAESGARALIQLADVPGGWTEGIAAEEGAICPGHDPFADVAPASTARSAFQQGDDGPFLASSVAEYAGEGRARELLAAAADAVEACEQVEDEGTRYRAERFTVRGLGDESLAARISVTSDGVEVDGLVYYVRAGRRVVTLTYVSLDGAPDASTARQYVEVMVDRL